MWPCPAPSAAAPNHLVIIHGNAEEMVPPRPMNSDWIAKPWEFCSSGKLSATRARKGCMLALMVPSNTQSSPAAIQTDAQLGIKIRAMEARMAPPRMNGRRRPRRVQVRSLV